jgi:outer membrane protein
MFKIGLMNCGRNKNRQNKLLMKRIFFLVNFLFFFLLMTVGQGNLQLADAVNIALKNSLDIQLSNNRIEIAGIFNNYGYAGGMPLVTGGFADNEQVTNVYQKSNTGEATRRDYSWANNLNANITGSILLYNGGRVIATKKRLTELQNQGKEQLNAQIQNVMASVMIAYYDVVRQQDYTTTIDRSIDASNQQLNLVKLRQKVGLANNADLFQAQIDLSVLQQAKLAQQLVIDKSRTELLRLLTLNPDSAIIIKDTMIIDKSIVLDSILNSLNKNADIRAAESQIRISELIVKETAAQRYPSIRATTGYTFSRNEAAAGNLLLNQVYGPTIGISLEVPIFNGSIYRRQQAAAQIDVRNANIEKQIILRDYNAQVIKQYQAYTNTISQLDTAKANYELSGKLLELTLLRFQLRQATLLEVKNAQQSFQVSGFRVTNVNFAAKSAEIELKRLANNLKL